MYLGTSLVGNLRLSLGATTDPTQESRQLISDILNPSKEWVYMLPFLHPRASQLLLMIHLPLLGRFFVQHSKGLPCLSGNIFASYVRNYVISNSIEDQPFSFRRLLIFLKRICIGMYNYHTIDIVLRSCSSRRHEILAFQIT